MKKATWLSASKRKENRKERRNRGTYLRREFSYSQFTRKMILPDNIEKDEISAKVENGVLTVTIPTVKEVEAPKPNRLIFNKSEYD